MTEDTKRALAIIEPMAKELRIKVDADDTHLYVGGETIGIACNSTYATIMEFIGYLVTYHANKNRWALTSKQVERVKRYWKKDGAQK